jgi:uncharacterized membrane protein YkoI
MSIATRQCRNRSRRHGLVAALLCAAAILAGGTGLFEPAVAEPSRIAQASNGISLAQATRMVREHSGGQVLRAETKRDKGRTVHRIRVITEDGRVRTWHVDAETGRIY